MSICINKFDPEYISLANKLDAESLKFLDYYALKFLTEKSRLPRLDEIPGATSFEVLKTKIGLTKLSDKSFRTETNKILEYTNSDNITDSVHKINNTLHTDLETEIIDCGSSAIVFSTQRPSVNPKNVEQIEVLADINPTKNTIVLRNMFYRLQKLYGIEIIPITNEELLDKKWDSIIPNSGYVNGFVYDGKIYINTDNAKLDTPIHELSHIFLGSLKFINPILYYLLTGMAESFKAYPRLASLYTGRTRSDINEEIFITEFSKYLVGDFSEIDSLNDLQIDEILYNMYRVLDSMVFGQLSTKIISPTRMVRSNLITLGTETLSRTFNLDSMSGIDYAYLHRTLNKTKSDLMRNNKLIELCE